jgi:hypothetical protein
MGLNNGGIMDLQKGFLKTNSSKEDIVKELNNCCLCGTTLVFTHVTHKETREVKEAAKCPACGIQTKVNTFSLQ